MRLLDYGFRSAFLTSTEKRRLRADCFHDTLKILSEVIVPCSSSYFRRKATTLVRCSSVKSTTRALASTSQRKVLQSSMLFVIMCNV